MYRQFLSAAILDVRNSFSFAFLAISDPTQTYNFFQNDSEPLWMSEIHFCLHFSPFFSRWPSAATFIFQPHYQKPFSSAKVLPILFAPYKVGSTLVLLNGF
jgi:hypothetical protein